MRRLAIAAAVTALMLGLGGCGDDDGGDTAAPDETTASSADENVDEYCDAALKIETFPEPEIDFEALTPEQQAEEAKKFGAQLQPLAADVQDAAPAEIREDIAVLVGALNEVTANGDFEAAFETDEVNEASDRAHEFDVANCDWGRADVTGVDYAYQGVPETVEAGPVSFEFANEGEEPHELVVLRINDSVEEGIEQLLALPEDEAMTKATEVGGTFAEPGDEDYAVLDLEPGRYATVCFIPVGGGEQGPPHFTRGMFAEFEVEA